MSARRMICVKSIGHRAESIVTVRIQLLFFTSYCSFKSSDLNAIYARLLTSGFIYGTNPKYS